MALTLETTMRNAIADAIDANVNGGTGTAQLKIETVADAGLATFNLQDPAFGNAATGTITLQGTPLTDSTASAGTAAQFSIYNKSAVKQLEGTVGTTGGFDIQISSTTIGAGDTVQLTSFTITCPA